MVRIKDIAAKAGVSTGTVDRVIHNRGRVAPDVKLRVLEIVKELNYVPNYSARALAVNRIYKVAVLIPVHTNDEYWYDLKAGIDNAAKDLKQYGMQVQYYQFDSEDANTFIERARQLTSADPDGILLTPVFQREVATFINEWTSLGIPYVFINTQIKDAEPLCFIGQDLYQSGLLAAKLFHYGLPDPCVILIVHIDDIPSNSAHIIKKEKGFRSYFRKNNLEDKYTIRKIELQRSDYLAFVKQLDHALEENSELKGIYVSTSKSYYISEYLQQKGRNDIRIIGYDLIPKNTALLKKGLISFVINQHPYGQGNTGVQSLADYLIFKKQVKPVNYMPLEIFTKENL